MVAGVALVPNWSAGAAVTNDPTVDAATKATFQKLADAVFTDRTQALVDDGAGSKGRHHRKTSGFSGKVRLSSTQTRQESSALDQLRGRKARLAKLGEKYSAGKTSVSLDATRVQGRDAKVAVTETTTLTYRKVRGNEPKTTGFQARHELTFKADQKGNWQLTGIRDTDDGVAVNQIAEPSVVTPPTAKPSTPAPTAKASTKPPTTAPATPAPTTAAPAPSTTAPSVAADGNPPAAPRAAITANPPAAAKNLTGGAYDYKAMAAYATKYWNNYNPEYPDFNGAGAGGDCTNFVSQSLKAGGWKHEPGYTYDFHKWFGNAEIQSDSFVGVNEFSWYALSSKRVTSLANVYQMDVGDVLQMDFNRDGSKDHTMIVTSRTAQGVPYLSYHSTNTYNRSVASIIASYPDAYYYAYRT
ncbi:MULTISPECIES: amidase domain-containing protein [unclassified Streptomyces]|uniref:amidase domain-containing protein n=1 Tax=unclassified Streptomyces TaxID=2593676 RepID=UPI001F1617D6|nr:amidase domain-containing protein [Streptomyces sp. CB01373]